MKRIILSSILSLLAASCLPQDVRVPQSPLLPMLERKSGLIAYIGLDGNMYVSDQAGGNILQLTKDATLAQDQAGARYYQYPTWSPDGSQVAFVGLSIDEGQTASSLLVANVDEESVKEVYASQSEHAFYLYWSPVNATVSFLSTTATGQNNLLQSIPAGGGERTIIDEGAPYYWSWAPDGRMMIIHTGSLRSTTPDHLAFLQLDPETIESAVDSPPASFQAPAWSPDGTRIALARVTDDENQIVVSDSAGENPDKIGTFTGKTAFAWSRDSRKLAYLDGVQTSGAGTVGALHVFDFETSEEIVEDQNIAAFFWSPDSEEIAYFILAQAEDSGNDSSGENTVRYVLELKILDVLNGESRKLFQYYPTDAFLNVLPYFDQYHQSATIWSPDNNNLVLSFLDQEGNPGIAIVAASGQLEPRLLADGYIAFWSWK